MLQASAIADALLVYRQPARLHGLKNENPPHDILKLIKIAAGDQAQLEAYISESGARAEEVLEAAEFYLHQMFLRAGNNNFKVLGLLEGATLEEIKLHKRWLLKWLHPDRNSSVWKSAFFNRVKNAAMVAERLVEHRHPKAQVSVLANLNNPKQNMTLKRTIVLQSGFGHQRYRPPNTYGWLLKRSGRFWACFSAGGVALFAYTMNTIFPDEAELMLSNIYSSLNDLIK